MLEGQVVRVFGLVIALFIIAGCSEPQKPTQLEHIYQSKTLRVGTLAGASNYYQGVQGEEGFEYELSQEFANYMGVELDIVPFF